MKKEKGIEEIEEIQFKIRCRNDIIDNATKDIDKFLMRIHQIIKEIE